MLFLLFLDFTLIFASIIYLKIFFVIVTYAKLNLNFDFALIRSNFDVEI